MTKMKFALVGNGFIGKKHKYFIEQNANAALSAIIDPFDEAADYPSISSFVESDQNRTDVVAITSPNGLHYEHASQLLNAGYHVLVEKPLSLKGASARALKTLAEEKGKKIFVVMQNRYSPASKWLFDLVKSNTLGELFMVQVNLYWNRDYRYYKPNSWHGSKDLDGGTIYTQFSHFIDMLYWCFGSMESFSGQLFDFNHQDLTDIEDSGMVHFKFSEGGHGQFNFSTSCYSRNLQSSITILAENGTVKLGGQYMEKLLHCDVKDFECDHIEPFSEEFGQYKGNAANHRFVYKNVIDTLNGEATEDTHIDDGVKVVEIIEDMYNSLR